MSPAAEYPKIASALREAIATGELAPGAPLPSEAALTARFGVARNTLRRALNELERDGLITVVPGKGRLVCQPDAPPRQADEVMVGYRRIAADLRHQIERGTYPPGARLPSEASLARQYDVSRETARRALEHLMLANLANVVQGKGWFVREGREDDAQDVRRRP